MTGLVCKKNTRTLRCLFYIRRGHMKHADRSNESKSRIGKWYQNATPRQAFTHPSAFPHPPNRKSTATAVLFPYNTYFLYPIPPAILTFSADGLQQLAPNAVQDLGGELVIVKGAAHLLNEGERLSKTSPLSIFGSGYRNSKIIWLYTDYYNFLWYSLL